MIILTGKGHFIGIVVEKEVRKGKSDHASCLETTGELYINKKVWLYVIKKR